jgi:hypothetical protein
MRDSGDRVEKYLKALADGDPDEPIVGSGGYAV